jgi:hypothetical protein
MKCQGTEETKLGQPFYAPHGKRFKPPIAGETKAYSISLLLYTVSTVAFYAQTIPHKSHYNTSHPLPSHVTKALGQYAGIVAQRCTQQQKKKIYDHHIFQPSPNMQKTLPGIARHTKAQM